jgi:Bifunctional DNA primase/polymerase, N-terminal
MAEAQRVNYALGYSHYGARVFPCHYIMPDGQCSCGGSKCRDDSKGRGKHPLHSGWQAEATADRQRLLMIWSDSPFANIGIACGRASNLTVVDVDGEVGLVQLSELESKYGALPDTPRCITGSGGCHLLFQFEEGLTNAVRWAPGLDIRTEGGLIIGAGSRNAFGEYIFEIGYSLKDLPRAKMPQWLIDEIRKGQGGSANATNGNGTGFKVPEQPVHEGEGRNNFLYRAGRSLKAKQFGEKAVRSALEETNRASCRPPISDAELNAIIHNVMTQRDSADFKGEQAASADSDSQSVGASSEPSRDEETSAPAYPWPEPVGGAAFHGPAGDFVKLVEPETEADPAALLIQFLVAMGNVVGRSVYRKAEGAHHFTNLFCVLTGPTGHGRKGSAWAQVLRVLYLLSDIKWVRDRKQTGLVSGEGLIWAVRDPIEREESVKDKPGESQVVQMDPGILDKRLLVVETEFSKVLVICGRDSSTLSQTLRQAWDSEKVLQTMGKNSPGKATDALISLIGHITDAELLNRLCSTEQANGFANRILWPCAKRSKLLPRGGNLCDEQLYPLVAKLDSAIAWAKARGVSELGFADEAWELWDAVYPVLTRGRIGMLGAMLNRAEAQTLRIACTYAMLDCSESIKRIHLEAALEVWQYCEASVEHIFGDRIGNPDADTILQALRAHKAGLSRTGIRNLFQRNLSSDRIEAALAILLKENLASFGKATTGGRDAEVWVATALTKKGQRSNG